MYNLNVSDQEVLRRALANPEVTRILAIMRKLRPSDPRHQVMQRKVENIVSGIMDQYRREQQHRRESMMEVAEGMTPEEESALVINLNMAYLLSDMLDMTCTSINETIHRHQPDFDFLEFSGIGEIGKRCRDKTSAIMGMGVSMTFQELFGNYSDEALHLVRNKVAALIRKARQAEEKGAAQ